MNTYEYKFIKLKLSIWTGKPKQDYQMLIAEQARHGWRLTQIIVTTQYYEWELIFERLL
ncbi:MAG: DUF4177 domain-containing protein [Cytophagales bacterium]|nr:MAG: DUF4177 domain-containing protein [Cytophagales bacterium]